MNPELLPADDGAPPGIEFSIVIPALNEERVIGDCLASLTRLDISLDAFEVIVVDNGSCDRTLEIARSRMADLNLRLLQKKGVPVSALRNLGAARARGKILAFLDSDCTVPAAWLSRARAWLQQEGIGIVGAHFRIPEDSRWVARVWYGDQQYEKQGDLAWVPGCNTILRRETFERLGGFDESIRTNEDCEFCDRAKAAGLRVVGDPEIAVVHLETPQTLAEFYRKILWHGTDGLRVFLRELPKISNPRPLLFAFYTLACLGGLLIGLAAGAWQKRWDILAFFAAALILPSFLLSLRLALRRRCWSQLLPLIVMNLVFGLARAQSLVQVGNWRRPKRASGDAT